MTASHSVNTRHLLCHDNETMWPRSAAIHMTEIDRLELDEITQPVIRQHGQTDSWMDGWMVTSCEVSSFFS